MSESEGVCPILFPGKYDAENMKILDQYIQHKLHSKVVALILKVHISIGNFWNFES